jgi:hypothetical protein
MDKGYFERIVPHEMRCAIFGPYPRHSGKPCNCPVKIVRELEAENRELQTKLDMALQRIYNGAMMCQVSDPDQMRLAVLRALNGDMEGKQ